MLKFFLPSLFASSLIALAMTITLVNGNNGATSLKNAENISILAMRGAL